MKEETKSFIEANICLMGADWTLDQQANEIAMFIIEDYEAAGIPGLIPELSIDGGPGVSQEKFDREVEGAFSWLTAEVKAYLTSHSTTLSTQTNVTG